MKNHLFWLAVLLFPLHAYSAERVVSVGGTLTEIIYAIGAEKLLVGSDTTSYYPPAAAALPKVGYHRSLSAEGILSLTPDLIILGEESGPPVVLKQLKTVGVELLVNKSARSLNDVKYNISNIAKVLNRDEQGKTLIKTIEIEHEKLKGKIAKNKDSKKVVFIMQVAGGAPLAAGANTAANSIIQLSGATNVVTEYEGYKPLSPESLTVLNPEVIITTTQALEQVGGIESVLKLPGISVTPAAKNGRVVVMDALKILGLGPRSVEAAFELNQKVQSL